MTAPVIAPLREGQWQIEDLIFGKDTEYVINTWPDISYAETEHQDARVPRGDGLFFGRDYRGGNLITFELSVWSDNLDYDLQRLAKWWLSHPARKTPGATVPLKYCYEGKMRQVFGRPRNFAPIPGPTNREWIDVIMDFQCIDDKFYSQEEFRHRIEIAPPALGGFITPLIPPLIMSGTTESNVTEFSVGGSADAWVKMVLRGPITRPQMDLFGQWTQTMPNVSLNYDQSVTISSYPWDRKVVRNDGTSLGGAFDYESRKLSALTMPPGDHELVLRGNDQTGTAHVDIFWYETYLSL